MMEFLESTFNLSTSAIRMATPLILAALGGMMSERSGVINIALEGLMLIAAFFGAVGILETGSPMLGLLIGVGSGMALAAIYGVLAINFRGNQIVAGAAINMLALGLTAVLCKMFFDSTTATPSIPIEDQLGYWPYILTLAIFFGALWLMKQTPLGLWIQVAGEHPKAIQTAGLSVKKIRWTAVLMSGAFAGMGGVALSCSLSSSFTANMTAGRGFMALAALIFGGWRPIPAALACLLFGFADAIQIRLQGAVLPGTDVQVPVQFIQIIPYVVTIAILAGFVGRSRAPKSLGIPVD